MASGIKLNLAEFIERANKIHKNHYGYDTSVYKNAHTKLEIVCFEHGAFLQKPYSHLNGAGCPKCYGTGKGNTETFIEKAIKIHGDKYDYSLVDYHNNFTHVKIVCSEHGTFSMKPNNHLSGYGCYNCNQTSHPISKLETIWLDSLNVPVKHRNNKIVLNDGSIIKPDGFNPETNTIYEFWGDYWHGNPKKYNHTDLNKSAQLTYGELYQRTLTKIQKIKENGFVLIDIWENDFMLKIE